MIPDRLLVADIGGTNARFAIAAWRAGGGIALSDERRFAAEDFGTLSSAIDAYFEASGVVRPARAAFAVAGPIVGDAVRLTNSAWAAFSAADLAARAGLERVLLANDWAAAAAGAAGGGPDVLEPIAPGTPAPGAPVLALGAGTGLGAGYAADTATGLAVFPAEAGHAAFAPRSDEEDAVLALLRREQAYVSYESVLSGRGLVAIHRALCERAGHTWPASTGPDISAAATATGPERPFAREAAEVFLAALGTFAGSAAVILGARGGVCVGGGVVEALAPLLPQSPFLARFHDLGPMSHYTHAIPVWRITDTVGATLRGAARLAGAA